MNLVELTLYSNKKITLNFVHVVYYKVQGENTLICTDKNGFEVKETPEEIEKLLREIGHYVKRSYKPEVIFVPSDSGVKSE